MRCRFAGEISVLFLLNRIHGALIDSVADSIASSVTPAVNQALVLAGIYGISTSAGGLIHAKDRENEEERLRSLLVLQVQAIDQTTDETSLFWTGVAFHDGWSYYVYPTNSSWVSHSVKSYRGVPTNGYAYEAGPSTPGVMNVSWLGTSGELLYPRISHYQWSAATAATVVAVTAAGQSIWEDKLEGWAYQGQMNFGTPVKTNESNTIGVAYFGVKVDLLERNIQSYTNAIAGSLVFVIDTDTDLVFSSVSGVAFSCPSFSTCNQIQGIACSDATIASVAQELLTQELLSANSHLNEVGFAYGTSLVVSTLYLAELGGMPLSTHWLVVAVEPILCSAGYYLDATALACTLCPAPTTSAGGTTSCDLCLEDYYLAEEEDGECLACPSNAYCAGGEDLPRPLEGYWVERRNTKFASSMHECFYDSCKGANEGGSSCWSLSSGYSNQSFACSADNLLCLSGAGGPLCGSCLSGYYFASLTRTCVQCRQWWLDLLVILTVLCIALFAGAFFAFSKVPKSVQEWWVIGICRKVDSGVVRVVISNYQILRSISWSRFPRPYSDLLNGLGFLTFDFASSSCVLNGRFRGPLNAAYIWSGLPLAFALCIALSFAYQTIRNKSRISDRSSHNNNYSDNNKEDDDVASGAEKGDGDGGEDDEGEGFDHGGIRRKAQQKLVNSHSYYLLLLSYLVLPAVTHKQFLALDCFEISGGSYLRADTAVSCKAKHFHTFRLVDFALIAGYLSVLAVWARGLWRFRRLLMQRGDMTRKQSPDSTEDDDSSPLAPLRFLYQVYRPRFYWWEVFDMLRRISMVSVLPLLSESSGRRAALGLLLSLCSLITYREVQPFKRGTTNLLAYIAQWTILITYGASLAIESGVGEGENSVWFGTVLVLVNVAVLGLGSWLAFRRYMLERAKHTEQKLWRRALSTQELQVVQAVMGPGIDGDDDHGGEDDGGEEEDKRASSSMNKRGKGTSFSQVGKTARLPERRLRSSDVSLHQYILPPEDVVLLKRVGAGSFGEVFQGTCVGEPVAVKTLLEINKENVNDFKKEILLTATLRHPNVVAFVGACLGRDLICLVLEWVPRGSIADYLEEDLSSKLTWSDPLLRLAMDVARGMVYLHDRKNPAIVHRDLKPDNCLVTDFLSAKITDFGISRAKEMDEEVTMTSVGTPLYCAPEVMRGDPYTETVDAFSFGMSLLDMAVEGPLLEFINARWCKAFEKAKAPSNPIRVMRQMNEKAWRPVTHNNPLPWAPVTVNDLLVRCCDHDPKRRPTFREILRDLSTLCKTEIDRAAPNAFVRGRDSPAKTIATTPRSTSSTSSTVNGKKKSRSENNKTGGDELGLELADTRLRGGGKPQERTSDAALSSKLPRGSAL